MGVEISSLDLLLLTLCVAAYAAGATAWTWFVVPPQEREAVPSALTGATGADFFDRPDEDARS